MIRREKPEAPAGLTAAKWNSLRERLLVEKHAHKLDNNCYRKETINQLLAIFDYKCAYCENIRGSELQVDHFRPFAERNAMSKANYNQPGYYWLAYSWENLLPACSKCNRAKSNYFPLKEGGERVYSHNAADQPALTPFEPYNLSWLQEIEQPLLLLPSWEGDLIRHFLFKNNGEIQGRTVEGIETIKICDLNRGDLQRRRIEIRKKYVKGINSAVKDFAQHLDSNQLKGELSAWFKLICNNRQGSEEHSLYHIYIYRYFEYYIGSFLELPTRQKTIDYFQEFKRSK